MTLTEQVFAQAALLAGGLDGRQTNLLRLLCGASASSLTARLREGLTPEDCKADFIAAASLLALAQMNGVDDAQVEEFKAGDLTVKQGSKNRDAASQCLQRQAELMIAPYLTVEAGLLRRKKCAALGAGRGYRTQLSMASQEAWDFAQQLCSKRYILGGIVMGIAALLLIKAAPVESVVSLYVFTVVIGLFEVVAVILLIASVETSLRKRYAAKTAA